MFKGHVYFKVYDYRLKCSKSRYSIQKLRNMVHLPYMIPEHLPYGTFTLHETEVYCYVFSMTFRYVEAIPHVGSNKKTNEFITYNFGMKTTT